MTFGAPCWLLALVAVVAAAWRLARTASRRRAQLPGARGTVGGRDPLRWRGPLEWSAAVLVVAALALPRFDVATGAVPRPAVLLVDVSRSMLAEDEAGARFGRAKRVVASALEAMAGRRVGLVTFAGSAEEIAPPTTDFQALRALLDEVDPRLTLDPGSDVAAGLTTAIDRLQERGGDVFVLSDGEWEGERGRELAAAAGAPKVSIHVVPLGGATPVELAVREEDGSSVALVDGEGRRAVTRADRSRLERLATAGLGRVVAGEIDVRSFAFAAADRRDAAATGGPGSTERWQPWSCALALAFAVLVAAHALRERVS